MKVVLLGANGRLGSVIKKKYPEVIGFDLDVDITNREAVHRVIKKEKPSVIINCAALTDVEYCEKNPKECWKVNCEAVGHLADIAVSEGANLIHISSDYALKPVNEYGRAKRASEYLVRHRGLVLRTDLYDKNTFVIKKLLFSDDSVPAYFDKFFNPISMFSFADALFGMLEMKGLCNIATKERLSMVDFALKVCKIFQLNEKRVLSVQSDDEKDKTVKRSKELYLEPCNSLSIDDDLRRFKNELERDESLNHCVASR